jgi:uncharacterized protein (TIGR02118 family)
MAKIMVLYRTPKDTAAFDKYYFDKHVPTVKKLPGLRKLEVSQGPVATPAGPSPFHLIDALYFDDMAAIQKGYATPEGQALAADMQNFASGGADVLIFDSREV